METQFKKLVLTSGVYPLEFVKKFGEQGKHWSTESWIRREWSLRHDMVCILLANCEPSDHLLEMYLGSIKRKRSEVIREVKRARLDENVEAHLRDVASSNPVDARENQDDSGPEEDYDSDDIPSPESFVEQDFEAEHHKILEYRYIVLEAVPDAALFQNYYADKWGYEHPTRQFDLIDTTEKLFIEIKVSNNVNRIEVELASSGYYENPRYAYTIFSTTGTDRRQVNKSDEYPGISKVHAFFIKRSIAMAHLGIEDSVSDFADLSTIMFQNPKICQYIKSMEELISSNLKQSSASGFNTDGFKIEPIEMSDLFNLLVDPTEIESEETVTWKGKLTPIFYCNPLELMDETDEHAVEYFMQLDFRGANKEDCDDNLYKALMDCMNAWMHREPNKKQFGFIETKGNKVITQELREALGIGRKGKVYTAVCEDAVQVVREPLKPQRYDIWFEKLYEDLSKMSNYEDYYSVHYDDPNISSVPLYRFAHEWTNRFVKEIGFRNVGMVINQWQNFFSRFSGAYNTTIGGKTTHNKIAVIPIKVMLRGRNGNDDLRLSTGIAIRGPHHMTSPTDKANFLIAELINDDLPEKFYKKMNTITLTDGTKILLRKTSIKKIDGIHLSFLENSIFMACNMIGDMLLNDQSIKAESRFKQKCVDMLNHGPAMNFFVDRVIDAVVMAVIGNPRDEGFLSVFRKLIMVGISSRRGKPAFTFTTKGLCDKLNENILDNPFSMHLLLSYKFCLCIQEI